MGFDRFREDPKTVAAVERKFLVIGEAAVRLGRDAPLLVADVPWRQIRDLGNLLRHAYDKVDLEIIWQTMADDPPPLEGCCSEGPANASVQSASSGSGLILFQLGPLESCDSPRRPAGVSSMS
jgi:uncharacterized protein with HEPN domain